MSSDHLPEPRQTRVYRLKATLGQRHVTGVIYETYLVG